MAQCNGFRCWLGSVWPLRLFRQGLSRQISEVSAVEEVSQAIEKLPSECAAELMPVVQRYSPESISDQTAQRLAQLLISEIKLYNQVETERTTKNLYDTLKDPIEKARIYYAQRLGPKVAEGMPDYFHAELVRLLCNGDPTRLGSNYR